MNPPPPKSQETTFPLNIDRLLADYKSQAAPLIEAGKKGDYRIPLDEIHISLTDNCNLRCGWCHPAHEGFANRYISLDQFKSFVEKAGNIKNIHITSYGEAFSNPELLEILQYCKTRHPENNLWLTTNGTYPAKGKNRDAISLIDRLGISIDGATAETYERLREPARFDKLMENIKAIVEIKKETGRPRELQFIFVASKINLHELPDLAQTAVDLKHINSMVVQPMNVMNAGLGEKYNSYLLETIPDEERVRLVLQAKKIAERAGIKILIRPGMFPNSYNGYNPFNESERDLQEEDQRFKEEASQYVPFCRFPWKSSPMIHVDGSIIPCCIMDPSERNKQILKERYGLHDPNSRGLQDIFNSEGLWRFREDLLNGNVGDLCGNCNAAKEEFKRSYLATKRGAVRKFLVSITTLSLRQKIRSLLRSRLIKSWTPKIKRICYYTFARGR